MKEQTKLEAKKTAFNQAVGRQIGVQADALTPDVVGAAQKDVGEAIGRMAERSAVKPQHVSSLVSRLADIEFEATRFGTSDTQKAARNLVDEVLNKIRSEDGTIEGPAFRELNTLMGKLSAKGGDVGARAGEIGFALRQAMGQSLPQNQAKAWNALNSKYQNVLAVAPVAARSPTGDISGAGLLASVNSKLKRSKYGSNQDINELARMGKALVSDLTPNSGTAQKTMIAEMLSNPIGGLTQLPTIPAQMLLNNQALIRLLAEGPEGRKLLGPAIKGATYATMPLGGGRAGLLADDIQNATWRD
jgi:hypothetical protein